MKNISIHEHFNEIRIRLIRMAVILCVVFIGATYCATAISDFLLLPLRNVLATTDKVIFLNVLDKVVAIFQVSAWVTIIVTIPLWMREIWSFIRPALYPKEVRIARTIVILGVFLFYFGLAFGYLILVPASVKIFMSFGFSDVEAMIGLKEYLSFICKFLIVAGIIFQLPLIILALSLLGLVSKHFLAKYRRYAYVLLALIAAIITPADVLSMLIVWIPLMALFELGVMAVNFLHPYLSKKGTSSP